MALKLPGFVAGILKSGLELAQRILSDQIKKAWLKTGLNLIFPPVTRIVTVLSDDNPANEEQIGRIMKEWVGVTMIPYLKTVSSDGIEKINDEKAKRILTFVSPTVLDMIGKTVDENPNNGPQILALWSNLLKNPDFQDLIIEDLIGDLIAKKFSNPDVRAFAELILRLILQGGINQLPDEEEVTE